MLPPFGEKSEEPPDGGDSTRRESLTVFQQRIVHGFRLSFM